MIRSAARTILRKNVRFYSSARPEPPRLRYIIAIAILSTVTFAISVRTLDKKAPKTQMTVAEYEHNKRKSSYYKRAAFAPGETTVILAPDGVDSVPPGYIYLSIDALLHSKDNDINKYQHIVQRFEEANLPIPLATKEAIIQDAMNHHMEDDPASNKFVVGGTGYPASIEEAIQFERDVAPVAYIISQDDKNPVSQYFQTVGKVKKSLEK